MFPLLICAGGIVACMITTHWATRRAPPVREEVCGPRRIVGGY